MSSAMEYGFQGQDQTSIQDTCKRDADEFEKFAGCIDPHLSLELTCWGTNYESRIVLPGQRNDMIDGLISGKLYGEPATRVGKSGKPFVITKVRAAAGDGEALFVNVIAFDDAPCAALLALSDGDSVALAGSLTPKVWTDKEGATRPSLDMVAAHVLTAYHVTRKRKAIDDAPPAQQHQHGNDFPSDSLDF